MMEVVSSGRSASLTAGLEKQAFLPAPPERRLRAVDAASGAHALQAPCRKQRKITRSSDAANRRLQPHLAREVQWTRTLRKKGATPGKGWQMLQRQTWKARGETGAGPIGERK